MERHFRPERGRCGNASVGFSTRPSCSKKVRSLYRLQILPRGPGLMGPFNACRCGEQALGDKSFRRRHLRVLRESLADAKSSTTKGAMKALTGKCLGSRCRVGQRRPDRNFFDGETPLADG